VRCECLKRHSVGERGGELGADFGSVVRAIIISANLRAYSRVWATWFLARPCLRHGLIYVIRYVPYLLADVHLALWYLVVAPVQTFTQDPMLG
jgi:hypothetical protein